MLLVDPPALVRFWSVAEVLLWLKDEVSLESRLNLYEQSRGMLRANVGCLWPRLEFVTQVEVFQAIAWFDEEVGDAF